MEQRVHQLIALAKRADGLWPEQTSTGAFLPQQ
jgi:hypothetical protein